ncbi:MAG: phosphate ABC transporter, permease protein PstA, partial [Smithella sp.]
MNKSMNSSMRWRYLKQTLFFGIVRLSFLIIALALGGLLLYIVINGIGVISWDFITKMPMDSMTK